MCAKTNTDCVRKATENIKNPENNIENIPRVVWGQLVVIRRMNKKIDLDKPVFTVGLEKSDLNLSTDEMSNEHLQFISRVHFKLERDIKQDAPVYLEDLSRNGTFINGEKVGRGNTRILQDDDIIAIGSDLRKVFKFFDRFLSKYSNIPTCIKEDYYISRELGVGACGIVRLIFNKRTCAKFAMKQITKRKGDCRSKLIESTRIMNEANIMKKLHHPFIVNIYNIVETPEAVFLILELMEGGDLYTRITKSGRLKEPIVKEFFFQLAVAVNYLHSKNITHRDLKPENILLLNHEEKTTVKLSDFGLSKIVDEGTSLRTECGTAMYVAPEILKKDIKTYTDKVDVWSLGVILYVSLSGCVPFSDNNCSLVEQICNGKYSFKQRVWNTISEPCKDLICKMLTVDPQKRLSSAEVLQHEWLQDSDIKEEYGHLLNQSRDQSHDITVTDLEESLVDVNCNNTFSESSLEPPKKKHCSAAKY